jgi:hypothetical protein
MELLTSTIRTLPSWEISAYTYSITKCKIQHIYVGSTSNKHNMRENIRNLQTYSPDFNKTAEKFINNSFKFSLMLLHFFNSLITALLPTEIYTYQNHCYLLSIFDSILSNKQNLGCHTFSSVPCPVNSTHCRESPLISNVTSSLYLIGSRGQNVNITSIVCWGAITRASKLCISQAVDWYKHSTLQKNTEC